MNHSLKIKKSARILFWIIFPIDAILTSSAMVKFFAQREAWKPIIPHEDIGLPSDCGWMFVVARGTERQSEKQVDIPFRNSLLAIYRRSGTHLIKESQDYLCRSESTGIAPPLPSDIHSYIKGEDSKTSGVILYGYCSVPEGFFHIQKKNYGYLISDWGRDDGKVALPAPMVLKSRTVTAKKIGNKIDLVMNPSLDTTVTVSKEKDGCYIHGTLTRHWSHRDALGCITLFDKDDPTSITSIQNRGWNSLTKELQNLGIYQSNQLGLFITDIKSVIPNSNTDASKCSLPALLEFVVIKAGAIHIYPEMKG